MTNDKKTSGAMAHYVTNRPMGSVVSQLKGLVEKMGFSGTIEVVNYQSLEAAQKRILELEAGIEALLARWRETGADKSVSYQMLAKLAISQTSEGE